MKTYDDVAREDEFHPESKGADADGSACEKQTVGLLQRRHVYIDLIKYVGKESNNLEDVDAGLVHSGQGVYTEYPDPRRDEWKVKFLPALRSVALQILVTETGMSRRALQNLRAERSRPHLGNLATLVRVLQKLGPLKGSEN